jgi:hypothetical protein
VTTLKAGVVAAVATRPLPACSHRSQTTPCPRLNRGRPSPPDVRTRQDSRLALRAGSVTGRSKRKRPRRSQSLQFVRLSDYCRGTSGAACGVVALGLAGSGAAGGTGAGTVRPVVSGAGVVAVRFRLPLAANARIPARSSAPIMAGVTQPGRSLTTRRLSGFILSRASMWPLGSFIVIGHFLVVVGIERAIAESVPSPSLTATRWSTLAHTRFLTLQVAVAACAMLPTASSRQRKLAG